MKTPTTFVKRKSATGFQNFLRNAATITLFATAATHQAPTAKATDWLFDFSTSSGTHTSSTASSNNALVSNSVSNPAGGPTTYIRSSTTGSTLGTGLSFGSGDSNLGTGSEVALFSGNTTSGTFLSFNDWTPSKYYDVRFSAVMQGSYPGTGNRAYAQFSIGDGASYSTNNPATAAQIAASLRFTFGASNTVATTWNPTSGSGATWGTSNGSITTTGITSNGSASAGTVLNFRIVGNNDTTSQNYSVSGTNYSLASNTYDIFLNDVLIGNDIAALLPGVNVDSLQFAVIGAQTSTSSALKLDNIIISNALTAAVIAAGNYWNGANGAWSSSSTNWATATAGGGTTGLTQAASGALIFDTASAAPTVNDTVTVNAGITFGANGISISPGTGTPLISLAGAIVSANALAVTNAGDTATISVKLTGSNGLTMSGPGKLILSGANSGLTGAVTLSAGTLRGTVANALGGGTLVISGGTLELANDADTTFGRNTTISANTTIKSDRTTSGAGTTQTLGTLSMGAQTLTIDKGANVASGTAGLAFGAVTLTGAPTFTVNSDSLLTLASISGTAQNLVFNGAGSTTVSGAIATTTGTLNKSGAGTLTLSGTNTYSGATTISGGTLSAASGALNGTASITVNAATLNAVNFNSGINLTTDASGTANISGTAGQSVGTLSNAGNTNFTGTSGTVTISTLSGAGTTAFSSDASISTLSGNSVTIASGKTLTVGSGTTSGVISGDGALIKSGNGTLSLTGANTYAGGTTLNSGTIALAGSGVGALGAGTVAIGGGTLSVTNAAANTAGSPNIVGTANNIAGNINLTSGTIDLTAGSLTLGGDLTASGGNINYTLGKTLAVTGALSVSGTVNINLSGTYSLGTFTLLTYGSSSTASAFTFNSPTVAGRTFTIDTSTAGQYNLVIAQSSSNITWNLGTGGAWDTTTTANWLNGAATQAYVDGDNVTFSNTAGGSINIASNVTPGNVTVSAASGTYTFSGDAGIAGATGITKSNNGTLAISNANSYTGETAISAGVVQISNANALGGIGSTAKTTVAAGSALEISGGITTAAETLEIAGSGISSGGALRSTSGNNTFAGAITLTGAASIASDADTFTITGGINNGGNLLTISGAGNTTVSTVKITGAGGLTKSGNGTLSLNGANDYTGATTINGGVIQISNANSLGGVGSIAKTTISSGAALEISGGITTAEILEIAGSGISSGGALRSTSGNNTFSGATTLTGDATIASDAGTLTLTGGVTNGGSLLTVSGAGNTTLSTTKLTGAGGLTKSGNGTLSLNFANDYAGETTLSGGTLSSITGALAGTSGITVTAGTLSAVDYKSTASLTVAASATANISGAGLTVGTITNAGNVNFTGNTGTITATSVAGAGTTAFSSNANISTISAGTTTVAGTSTVGTLSAGTLTSTGNATVTSMSGGTFNSNGNATITTLNGGALAIASTKTATISAGSSSGIISGSGAIAKTGADTLTLSGNNSYSAGTSISGGTVKAANNNALGSSTVTITSGNLYAGAGNTVSNAITIGSFTAGSTSLLAGWDFQTTTTGGTAALAAPNSPKVFAANFGAGNLYLDGSNGSSNWVTATSGNEVTSFGGNAGSGVFTGSATTALALLGGAATPTANGKYMVFAIDMSNKLGLTISYDTRGTATGFTNQIWEYSTDGTTWSSAQTIGSITSTFASKSLSEITALNGDSTAFVRLSLTGATNATGNNRLDNIAFNALSQGSGTGSGTLGIDTAGTATFSGLITNNNTATFTAASGGTANFTNVISGLGTINKTGAGTVNLSAVNTYSGATTVSNGILNIASGGSIASSAVTVANAATLKATNSSMPASAVTGAITLNSGALVDLTEGSLKATSLTVTALSGTDITKISYTIGSSLALTGALTLNGNLAIDLTSELTGANEYDVITWTGSRSGSGVFAFIDRSTANWIMTGVETAGKYTIKVAAPFTEGGNATSGTITIPNGGSLGDISGTAVVTATNAATISGTISGGTVELSGANSSVNTVAAGNVKLTGGSSSITAINGTASVEISGNGNTVTEVNGGTVDIKGETTVTTISAGNVSVNSNVAVTTLSGGNLTLANGNTLTVSAGSSAGTIAGSGTLAKTGTGTLELSGDNSTFTGATEVGAGKVKVTNINALGSTSGVTLGSNDGVHNATLEIATTGDATVSANIVASNSTAANIIQNTGTGTVTLAGDLTKNGTVLTLAGNMKVTGEIIGSSANSDLVISTGTVTVESANSYTGPTFINSGATLIALNDSATGNGVVNVGDANGGGTLQVGNSSTHNITLTTNGLRLYDGSTIRIFVDQVDITGLSAYTRDGYTHYDLTGTAGTDYGTILSGALNVTGVTAGGITIEVYGTTYNTPGLLTRPFYDFKFLEFTTEDLAGLGNSLDITDLFTIDTTNLRYQTGDSYVRAGYNNAYLDDLIKMYAVQNGNNTVLMMSIPEPSTYGLGLGALALAAVAIRRRKLKMQKKETV